MLSQSVEYRDFVITFDPPPIPSREHDWQFVHKDYDGPEDRRCGTGSSAEDCRNAIDDLISELHPVCETCDGSGRVPVENRFSVDTGTKWQRNYCETLTNGCDDCGGSGTTTAG